MNGMAPDGFDARTIADAIGLKKRAINECAAREGWPYRSIPVRGGWKRLYHMAGLPPAVLGCVLRAQAGDSWTADVRSAAGGSQKPNGGDHGRPVKAGSGEARLALVLLRAALRRLERALAEADLFVGGGR